MHHFLRALLATSFAFALFTFTACQTETETEVETSPDGTTEVETEADLESGLGADSTDDVDVVEGDVVDGVVDRIDSTGAVVNDGDAIGDPEDDGAGQ